MGFDPELVIVLGSSSPWRAQVLKDAGLFFQVMSPDIDEKAIRDPSPLVLTRNIARAKSEALRHRIAPEQVLLTADQVVTFRGEIREKPADAEQARLWLHGYAHASVAAISSVVAYDGASKASEEGAETVVIRFKPSLASAVDALIADGEVLKSSGAVVVEHPLMVLHVEWVIRPYVNVSPGHTYGPEALAVDEKTAVSTSISGLPLQLVYDLLAKLGRRNFPPAK